MSNTDCTACKENPKLTYVSIDNITGLARNIKIEAIGHNDLYFCTETDSSATVTDNSLTTCLSPKNPCNYATNIVTDLEMDGLWSVELEDGTLIEDKTLEELSEILLEYEILLSIPPDLALNCENYSELSTSFSLNGDFDYDHNRDWAFYLNGTYIGTTGMILPSGNKYDYMEALIPGETGIEADYPEHFSMFNSTDDVISVAFVPTSTNNLRDDSTAMQEYNESYSYDPKTGTIRFCLMPAGTLEIVENDS